jgi:hypothetical protein
VLLDCLSVDDLVGTFYALHHVVLEQHLAGRTKRHVLRTLVFLESFAGVAWVSKFVKHNNPWQIAHGFGSFVFSAITRLNSAIIASARSPTRVDGAAGDSLTAFWLKPPSALFDKHLSSQAYPQCPQGGCRKRHSLDGVPPNRILCSNRNL